MIFADQIKFVLMMFLLTSTPYLLILRLSSPYKWIVASIYGVLHAFFVLAGLVRLSEGFARETIVT